MSILDIPQEFREEENYTAPADSNGDSHDGFVDNVRDQTASNLAFISDPLNLTGGAAESTADALIDTVTPGSGGDAGRPDSAGDLLPEGSLSAGGENTVVPDVTNDDGGLSFDVDIPWVPIALFGLLIVAVNAFAGSAGEAVVE